MRNVLIAYPSMGIGGSTTSLLGLLQYLPKEVHLLPQARIFLTDPIIGAIQRLCHPMYWEAGIRSVLAKKKIPWNAGLRSNHCAGKSENIKTKY